MSKIPPWRSWEETIDGNTTDEILHRIIGAAASSSDGNIVRAAANATAELARREQKQKTDDLVVQLNAQKKMLSRFWIFQKKKVISTDF